MPWLGTVHREYPQLIRTAGDSADPLETDDYIDEVIQLSHGLYTVLVGYCPSTTMSTVGQGIQDSNGFELWRRLVKQFESAPRTKALVWRKALANPKFPKDVKHWSEAFYQWDAQIREYERTFKNKFEEDDKLSILATVAPQEMQQSIMMHAATLDSYAKMQAYIEAY